jgi:hypothetical protein
MNRARAAGVDGLGRGRFAGVDGLVRERTMAVSEADRPMA